MQHKSQESMFSRIYLWMAAAKALMGLFFAFYVFMYLFFGYILLEPAIELDFFTSFEMLFASFFIGILQCIVIPSNEHLTTVRCALFVVSSVTITLAFSLVFGWFNAFPSWCLYAFIVITAIGICFMILQYHLQLQRETRQLNKQLEQFQQQQI